MTTQLLCAGLACPRDDSPLREGPRRSLGTLTEHSAAPPGLPGSSRACWCFRPGADRGRMSKLFPRNRVLPAPLPCSSRSQIPSLIPGKRHVMPPSPRLSFAHSLTTYWQKEILLSGCHQIFSLQRLCLLPSKFKICFHYRFKGINRNLIQSIRVFK